MPRSWPALDVHFPASSGAPLHDRVLAALDDFHPTAIDDFGDYHGARWRAFFHSPEVRDAAVRAIATAFEGLNPTLDDVPDEGWAERSQAALRAIQIGRILVAPPWDSAAPSHEPDLVVVINPSMGFGTGHHASTRLCLTALQALPMKGAHVVDVGTGSGLLAIAAIRFGAVSALAIDSDADAVASAAENIRANRVEGVVTLRHLDVRDLGDARADVVVANLTAALLEAAAHPIAGLARDGGYLVLGGFTESYEPGVVSAFAANGEIMRRDVEAGWVALTLRRRAARGCL